VEGEIIAVGATCRACWRLVEMVRFPSERGVLAAAQRDEMGLLGWK
jgi:hypothetical protein